MSFSQSISGLNSASGNLDVIGNNIANSATNGFKTSSASFADMFAGSNIGLGVKMQGVIQNFGDGSVSNTGRSLDVAISQRGFFRLQDAAGGIYYSRNGQFQVNQKSELVNMQGMHVMGYPATGNPATIQTGANPVPLSIPNTLMSAKMTTEANMVLNLKSSESSPAVTTFSATDPKSYNYKSSVTVYDSLGNKHNMGIYFVKSAAKDNTWNVHYVDSSSTTTTPTAGIDLEFNKNGELIKGAKQNVTTQALGGADPVTFSIDFAGTMQQNIDNSTVSANQDGYKPGNLVGYQISNDGTITGSYSNEQQQVLGQIVLANFANEEGLAPRSDNTWELTRASGDELLGTANSGNFGSLTSGALEASNVDLGKELVNMILAQRNYQSNAQSIKTQDQILNTLVNLR